MKTGRQQLLFGLSVYILGSCLFAAITYSQSRNHLLNVIDQRLHVAALATYELVDPLHKQNLNETSVSNETDYAMAMTLTNFARNADVEYVYSVIQRDKKIIFITSNATEEELANNTYEPAYWMDYGEADAALFDVFETNEIGFAEYTDRWGEFRSLFLPVTSNDGLNYVVGADISISDVNAAALQSVFIALMACLGFGVIAFPLLYFYIRSLRRESNLVIEQLYRCPLTGLPNRNRLLADIQDCDVANISVINIDKFREITMLYGPAIGDEVLKQFALRISRIDSSAVDNYKAYRLNADEFATLVTGKHNPDILKTQLEKLYQHLVKHPYQAGGKRIKIRIRMGAATNGEEAFNLADMALREARDNNKSLVVYDSNLHLPDAYQKNFNLTQQFRLALEEQRFIPFFQPILNTNTGKFDKFECLARMVDKDQNIIAFPDDFLPIAFRSRLYHQFTRLMLDKIFAGVNQHKQHVTINLSVSDIDHEPTTRYLYKRLSNANLAQRVEFEIMENENIENLQKIVRFIKRIQSYGCRVGMDDLGKDYSNFDRLFALPVDFVKIDGNIIEHLATDKEAQDIARMIISFAYRRKIKTIAEFCCDGRTSDMARRLGVDYLQGFHIGKPNANINAFLNPDNVSQSEVLAS